MQARHSIRTRLLALLLGLTIASVVTIAYLSVSSILGAGQSAQQASGAALRDQAKENLVRLTVVTAEKNNLLLENVRQDARNVAQYAAAVFERPEAFASEKYWRAKDHMFRGPQGQYINGKEDTSTVFVPNSVKVDDKLIADLELASYLDLQFIPVYAGGPNRAAIYFISKREFSRLYPNIGLGDILEPDYIATKDIFFTAGAPENDPKREVVWTPVYDDPAGQGLLVTTVAPVYTSKGEFLGIIGIDVSLASFSAEIEAASPVAGGYSFLVNDQRRAIALPKQGYTDLLGRSSNPGEFGADLSGVKPEFGLVLADMMAGSTGFQSVETGGRELFVAYAPLAGTQWSLATVVQAENMLQAVAALQQDMESSTQALVLARILPAGFAILVVAAIIGLLLTNRLVDPIQKLAAVAQEIGAGRWDTVIPQAGDDEMGVLAHSFRVMTAQIRELVGGLEQRVVERTAELSQASASLGRRVNQLQASSEVSRAVTTLTDPEQLIPRVVELIQQRFDFYYVGLFLVDADNRYAVLQAGTGEAGRTMKERGHRLEVGSQSMVGWVCANKQARIALDVGDEPVRFANPLLPDTHSEIALPLRVGERMLGVLDVQSTQVAAFDESDIAALQSMADQAAVALENARLFQQTQTALKDLEATNRLLARQGWQEYLGEARATRRAEFRVAGLPGSEAESPADLLTIPLELRGQSLGRLSLRREGDRPWLEEDIQMVRTVVLQTALAADNARLFEATQGALDESRALYQSSREITAAGEMSEVLSAVLDNLARTGIHAAAVALFDAPTREQAQHIELVGAWDHTGTPRLAPGVRFAIADFPLFNRITSEGTLVSSDLLADPEVDDVAKTVLGGLGLRAMAVTPLVARGEWIGVLFALVEQPHTFTPAEINFQRALADQAAVAIDSRRLFAETERRAEREQQIRQITNAIMSASRTEEALAAATDGLENLWNAALARIWLIGRDEQGEALFLRASAGLSRRLDGTRRRVPLSEAYKIGRIAVSGEPKFSTQLETDPEVIDHEWVRREGLRSFVGYPLKYGGRVVGVLGMYSRELYGQTEFALMGTLVQQMSTVLENRRLFDDTQRRAEREALVRQITTRIRAAGDIQGVLETTATELARSMGVSRAIVRLTMGDK